MGVITSIIDRCNNNPLALVAVSSLGFSTQSLLVKYLSITDFPTFEIIVARGCGQFLGVSSVLLWRSTPCKEWLGKSKTERVILFFRGFFGFFGMSFFFVALNKTTLANVQVAQQTVTIWTAILSRIFLGEPWFYPEMLTTVFAAAGVCLIFKPAFIFGETDDQMDDSSQVQSEGPLSQDSIGVIFALIGSLSSAVAYVLIRTLGTTVKVPWPTVMLAQALSQMTYAVPGLYITKEEWQLPNRNQAFYLLGCAFLGFSAQVCMTVGMQKSASASASLVRQTGIVYSFIFEVIAIPSETLSLSTIIGAIVIVIPITILGYYRSTDNGKPKTASELSLESDDAESREIVGKSVITPLAKHEKSTEEGEDEDEVDTSFDITPRKSNQATPSSKKASSPNGGKYSTIARVGSDEDITQEDDTATSFGFRYGNTQSSSTLSSTTQSWQALTAHDEDGGTGWDSWGNCEVDSLSPPSPSNVISSMKSSLNSVFKTGGLGRKQAAYRGIEFSEIDATQGETVMDAQVVVDTGIDDDDDDVDFGV